VLKNLQNYYLLLRHGRSLANQAGIIISSTDDGTGAWGLAEGACLEIQKSMEAIDMTAPVIFFSSPFKRAIETAQCACESFPRGRMEIASELRERFFGSYDRTADKNYHVVWQMDKKSSDNTFNGVESPLEVMERLTFFIGKTEDAYSGETIILVSHGDILNILLTDAAGLDIRGHRDIASMNTAELRPLFSGNSSSD